MSFDQQERAMRAIIAIERHIKRASSCIELEPSNTMAFIIEIADRYAGDVKAHRESKS